MAIWTKDKTASLAALEDFEIYYFNEATTIKTTTASSGNIIASFENFTPGDITNGGSIGTVIYNEAQAESAYNHPYNFYNDSGRLSFRFQSSNGNITGANFLINIHVMTEDVTFPDPDREIAEQTEFRIFKSEPAVGNYNIFDENGIPYPLNEFGQQPNDQVPGTAWLCNIYDDPINGITPDPAFSQEGLGNSTVIWLYNIEAWNDAKVTINDADFWLIDPISSE